MGYFQGDLDRATRRVNKCEARVQEQRALMERLPKNSYEYLLAEAMLVTMLRALAQRVRARDSIQADLRR